MKATVVRVPEPAQDDGPPIGPAFPRGLLQHDQVRRIRDVELAVAPGESHREDEVAGEDPRLAIPAVGPAVFEEADAAASRLRLECGIDVLAGRLGHEQPASVVEAGEHREDHVRLAGDLVNSEAFRDAVRGAVGRRGGDGDQDREGDEQQAGAVHAENAPGMLSRIGATWSPAQGYDTGRRPACSPARTNVPRQSRT